MYYKIFNYSLFERLRLIAEGFDKWKQSPIFGHGWGSTSYIVNQISLPPGTGDLIQVHPHFHNTFIQLIVELGVFGWAISLLIFGTCIYIFLKNNLYSDDKYSSIFIKLSCLWIVFSLFTQAMIFGGSRALPLILILSIISSIRTQKIISN